MKRKIMIVIGIIGLMVVLGVIGTGMFSVQYVLSREENDKVPHFVKTVF